MRREPLKDGVVLLFINKCCIYNKMEVRNIFITLFVIIYLMMVCQILHEIYLLYERLY